MRLAPDAQSALGADPLDAFALVDGRAGDSDARRERVTCGLDAAVTQSCRSLTGSLSHYCRQYGCTAESARYENSPDYRGGF